MTSDEQIAVEVERLLKGMKQLAAKVNELKAVIARMTASHRQEADEDVTDEAVAATAVKKLYADVTNRTS